MIFSVESIDAAAFDFDDGEFCVDETARGFVELVDAAGGLGTRALVRNGMSAAEGAV